MPAAAPTTSGAPVAHACIPTTLAYRCHSSRTHLGPRRCFPLCDANHERRDDADLPLRVVHLRDDGAAATPAAGGGVASSHSRG